MTAKTNSSPAGQAHPNYKHGMRSREWVETRKAINEMAREARKLEALTDADWDATHILDYNSRVVSQVPDPLNWLRLMRPFTVQNATPLQ